VQHSGADLGFEPSQIRKDLEVTGIVGKPKVGFAVPGADRAIEHFLGWDRVKNAVLGGGGGAWAALLGLKEFNRYGLRMWAF